MTDFDNVYQLLVEDDIKILLDLFKSSKEPLNSITLDETKKCIMSFKSGKSADEQGVMAEHLKYGGHILLDFLTKIINCIFENVTLPSTLKSGISCPIYKKGGKPREEPNSYRKITVTSTIGKVIEKLHLSMNSKNIKQNQSRLQKGFTEGESPSVAALILTELKNEAKETKNPLIVTLTDAQKAFDVVWHSGLMREMHRNGISCDNWLLFVEWYKDLSSKIKWNGQLSETILEHQGVRQGGVWSPTAYKVFVNMLLEQFEANGLGAHLGSVYCGIPTVADDVALVSFNVLEMQTMLDVLADYANKHRYVISSQKSCILQYGHKANQHSWSLNGEEVQTTTSAKHLGIEHDNTSKYGVQELVPNRIQTARKTVYALMGAGLHGLNGVNPKTSIHIVRIYVVPRLLYGLDAVRLTKTDVTKLTQYFTKLLRQLQHLPERTATCAIYTLIGQLPIEADLHTRILTLFGNIIRNEGSVEHDIAIRQLAVKAKSSNSWFTMVTELCEMYDLPSPHDLINVPPDKLKWKSIVKNAISHFWTIKLKEDVTKKSTLKFLSAENFTPGVPHNVWNSCNTDSYTTTTASVKAKILCGTYLLQSTRAKFDRSGKTSPLCKLCLNEQEDVEHFILQCDPLREDREYFICKFRDILYNTLENELAEELLNTKNLLQLIIDCSKFSFLDEHLKMDIECVSRGMCYRLHQKRASLLTINN